MSFVIEAPQQVTVPVVGTSATFPVARVYCVGRNYVEHAKRWVLPAANPPSSS